MTNSLFRTPDYFMLPEKEPNSHPADILKAIRIARATPMYFRFVRDQDTPEIRRDTDCMYRPLAEMILENGKNDFSALLIPAAIVTDDLDWLEELAEDASFECNSPYLDLAAQFGSLKCFNFLTSLGCASNEAIDYACQGGNEDIIQACIQQHTIPSIDSLQYAILGQQFVVAQWIIDSHYVTFSTPNLCRIFRHGCWPVFVNNYLNSFIQYVNDPKTEALDVAVNYDTILSGKQWLTANGKLLDMIELDDDRARVVRKVLADHEVDLFQFGSYKLLKLYGDVDFTPEFIKKVAMNETRVLLSDLSINGLIDCRNKCGETALMFCALESGAVNAVTCLVENGADSNAANSQKKTVLMYAVSAAGDNADTLQYLIDHDVDVDEVDNQNRTALMYAVKTQSAFRNALILMLHEAEINEVDNDGNTALMHSVIYQPRYELIALLLESGATVTNTNNDGNNLIHLLYQHEKMSKFAILQYLLEKGVDPILPNSDGVTPILLAMHAPFDLPCVSLLISKGARIDDIDNQGRGILHHIMYSADPLAALDWYCGNEYADVNQQDTNGVTPLILAVQHNHSVKVFEKLKSLGARVDIADCNGMTALMHAATQPEETKGCVNYSRIESVFGCLLGDNEDRDSLGLNAFIHATMTDNNINVMRWLLKRGFSVNSADTAGKTALMYAVTSPDADAKVEFLLSRKADPNLCDCIGYSPLMCLMEILGNDIKVLVDRDKNVFESLIAHGADVSAQTENGITVLMAAVMHNTGCGIQLLLANGCAIDDANTAGVTPLMYACKHSSIEMILFLIKRKANLNAADASGKTPLMYALEARQEYDVIRLLVDRGANVNAVDLSGQTTLMCAANANTEANIIELLTSIPETEE